MDNFSKQIYEAGINDGRAEGKAESIKNLMSTMNVSIDQAMDILKLHPKSICTLRICYLRSCKFHLPKKRLPSGKRFFCFTIP